MSCVRPPVARPSVSKAWAFATVIPSCRIKTPNSVVTGNAMREMIGHQPVEYPVNRHPVDLQTTPHLCHDLMMRQCARRIE